MYGKNITYFVAKYIVLNKEERNSSLQEVNESVDISEKKTRVKRFLAFLGPAYLISVGYMDPGNWATDIEAGSKYGYTLLWVLLMSNLIALLLQSFAARLGIVRRLDLAQASRELYPRKVNYILWGLAEIAIIATDLAEVIGMALGLKLIFGLPMYIGVCLAAFDSFLLIFLISYGIRKMEAFILTLVAIIGIAFFIQLYLAKPDIGLVVQGYKPSLPNLDALYVAIGIIGATVMPHNLYLHSSLVQTRKIKRTPESILKTIKYNFIDTALALNAAFFVNCAILILAATTFYHNGLNNITSIEDAHKMLAPLLGSSLAPILFGVALIAAGQSSTITGTLAGQIVMEGYLNLRIQPWVRRLITRLLAIVPALITIFIFGESEIEDLLILSQVALSLQLGFAIVPLIHSVSSTKKMKDFVIKRWAMLLGWVSTIIIVGLNLNLVFAKYQLLTTNPNVHFAMPLLLGAIILFFIGLLFYITFKPLMGNKEFKTYTSHQGHLVLEPNKQSTYKSIAITIDFSATDNVAINNALRLGGTECSFTLIHVVETATALFLGRDTADHETQSDKEVMNRYKRDIENLGYKVNIELGFGNPKKAIPKIISQLQPDLLIMGAHGHNTFKDIIFGTTINVVRHRVNVPVFIVQH